MKLYVKIWLNKGGSSVHQVAILFYKIDQSNSIVVLFCENTNCEHYHIKKYCMCKLIKQKLKNVHVFRITLFVVRINTNQCNQKLNIKPQWRVRRKNFQRRLWIINCQKLENLSVKLIWIYPCLFVSNILPNTFQHSYLNKFW